MAYNQRDIAGILAMIRHLGAMVGAGERGEKLAQSYEQKLAEIAKRAARLLPLWSILKNGTPR